MIIPIDKDNVFVSWNRWHAIRDEALKDKAPEFRCASVMRGSTAAAVAAKLMLNYLKTQKDMDPSFFDKWVKFVFEDTEAQGEALDLVNDYLSIYNFGTIKLPPRSFMEDMFDDWNSLDSFLLEVKIRPNRMWMVKKSPIFSLGINPKEITRIEGTLNNFIFYMSKWNLRFNEDGIRIENT